MSKNSFYLVHLIDADGSRLASDEVWSGKDRETLSADDAAESAALIFAGEPHWEEPEGKTIRLFGPFSLDLDAPYAAFIDGERVSEPAAATAPDFAPSTSNAKLATHLFALLERVAPDASALLTMADIDAIDEAAQRIEERGDEEDDEDEDEPDAVEQAIYGTSGHPSRAAHAAYDKGDTPPASES